MRSGSGGCQSFTSNTFPHLVHIILTFFLPFRPEATPTRSPTGLMAAPIAPPTMPFPTLYFLASVRGMHSVLRQVHFGHWMRFDIVESSR